MAQGWASLYRYGKVNCSYNRRNGGNRNVTKHGKLTLNQGKEKFYVRLYMMIDVE